VRSHFSNRLPWPNLVNGLSLQRAKHRSKGRDILDWSESNPTRVHPLEGFENEGLDSLLANPANLRYDPDPRGILRAREALAARDGQPPGHHFLTASTSEAYSWIFKLLCDPGDAVLVPKPGYPLFDYLAGLEAVEARPWRLEYAHPGGWHVDLDSIEAGLRQGRVKALVLINPNNPTGSYVDEVERAAILRIAAREGIALIVDEVFLTFPVEGEGRSFAGEEGVLTFVLDGLSKGLGLPQLKLGWILASGPGHLLDEALERLELIADTWLSAGTPVMNALPALLARAPRYASALGLRLARNLATLRHELEFLGSPHRVYRCEGGWTALIESPRYHPEEELAARLLGEAGLWSQPGHFFDLEREAFFTASLILPEAGFSEMTRRYRDWFEDEAG
jgi:aspartate/methionine/tyrosine aminotransferase